MSDGRCIGCAVCSVCVPCLSCAFCGVSPLAAFGVLATNGLIYGVGIFGL